MDYFYTHWNVDIAYLALWFVLRSLDWYEYLSPWIETKDLKEIGSWTSLIKYNYLHYNYYNYLRSDEAKQCRKKRDIIRKWNNNEGKMKLGVVSIYCGRMGDSFINITSLNEMYDVELFFVTVSELLVINTTISTNNFFHFLFPYHFSTK